MSNETQDSPLHEVVIDTETTGFDPSTGDRIVEIGALKLINHKPTGETFHTYICPERSVPTSAVNVHGLTDEFLSDKPRFVDIAAAFLDFIDDATLVAHNASFDVKFLNAELEKIQKDPIDPSRVLDTLLLARRVFPGAPASLDALCNRFGSILPTMKVTSALTDAKLVAEIYPWLLEEYHKTDAMSSKTSTSTCHEFALVIKASGRDPSKGHQLVAITILNLADRKPTGEFFHSYVCPEEAPPDQAEMNHGVTMAFLSDKPKFTDIADTLLNYIGDGRLVVYDASVDIKFLNAELREAHKDPIDCSKVINLLPIAQSLFSDDLVGIGSLCNRFGIKSDPEDRPYSIQDARRSAEIYRHLFEIQDTREFSVS